MKTIPHRLVVVALCVLAPGCFLRIPGCNTDPADTTGTTSPTGPTPTVPAGGITVQIQPKTVAAVVGESRSFEAVTPASSLELRGTTSIGFLVTGPLSVQQQAFSATAKCERAGAGTITAVVSTAGFATVRDEAVMTCIEAPPLPPTGNFVQITPTSIFFQHIVGTTTCPQRLTPLEIKNTSNRVLTVTVRAENGAIDARLPAESMAPGAVQMLEPAFNCRTLPPIKTNLIFTISADGVVQLQTVEVNGSGAP